MDDRAQRRLIGFRHRTRRVQAGTTSVAVLAAAVLFAGCTSSHPSAVATGSAGAPSPAPYVTTGTSAPSASAGAAATTRPAPRGSGSQTVVPTGGSAPYPTPGRVPPIKKDQRSVLNALPGSAAATCASVGSHADLRSGSIAAGNFVAARKQFRGQLGKTEVPEIGLYLIPQHAAHLTSAVVTVDPLGRGASRRVTTRSVEAADAARYFAVRIPVAAPGSYRLTMASGSDHGCFVVRFAG